MTAIHFKKCRIFKDPAVKCFVQLFIFYVAILSNIPTRQLQTEKHFGRYLMGCSNALKLLEEQNMQSMRFECASFYTHGILIIQNMPCTSIVHGKKSTNMSLSSWNVRLDYACMKIFISIQSSNFDFCFVWWFIKGIMDSLHGFPRKTPRHWQKKPACLFWLILQDTYTAQLQNHQLYPSQ